MDLFLSHSLPPLYVSNTLMHILFLNVYSNSDATRICQRKLQLSWGSEDFQTFSYSYVSNLKVLNLSLLDYLLHNLFILLRVCQVWCCVSCALV